MLFRSLNGVDSSISPGEDIERASSPTDAEVEDSESHTVEIPESSQRPFTPPPTSPTAVQSTPTSPAISSSDRKRNRSETSDSSLQGESTGKKSKSDRINDNEIPAGNDAETIGIKSPNFAKGLAIPLNTLENAEADKNTKTQPKMWFEDERTFKHWVERGRIALKGLEIEEQDGIETYDLQRALDLPTDMFF